MMSTSPSDDNFQALTLDPDEIEQLAELPTPSPSVVERLRVYGILPLHHQKMPERRLALLEQLFVTWYELPDNEARRASVDYIFRTELEAREVLLAIVPMYHDHSFFDEKTPTNSLIEIALIAHAKWRGWLEASSS